MTVDRTAFVARSVVTAFACALMLCGCPNDDGASRKPDAALETKVVAPSEADLITVRLPAHKKVPAVNLDFDVSPPGASAENPSKLAGVTHSAISGCVQRLPDVSRTDVQGIFRLIIDGRSITATASEENATEFSECLEKQLTKSQWPGEAGPLTVSLRVRAGEAE